jgi:hypothetical protein
VKKKTMRLEEATTAKTNDADAKWVIGAETKMTGKKATDGSVAGTGSGETTGSEIPAPAEPPPVNPLCRPAPDTWAP